MRACFRCLQPVGANWWEPPMTSGAILGVGMHELHENSLSSATPRDCLIFRWVQHSLGRGMFFSESMDYLLTGENFHPADMTICQSLYNISISVKSFP